MSLSLYDFEVTTISGEKITLAPYRGSVMLIVNVASKCGFTPQYEGLEKLFQSYRDEGLVILGFPCNQFKNQEPGSNDEIKEFCRLTYGVSFPLFAKIDVNGPDTHPLYQYLKRLAPGADGTEEISWNFTKFLVDRDGRGVQRFATRTEPAEIEPAIRNLL